ncbi:MAG: hypothetical protein FJ164_01570 [Gammaproteobacteria bacterium]|nr:hypothetical protein [Gammaproteobacteria bacterium]
MSHAADFPYPVPEPGTEPFWEGCNAERLLMQRCNACRKLRWHPAPLCIWCQHEEHEWVPVSGRGRIHTWTVITHPVHPAAVDHVPYVVVEVALDEQSDLRMVSNLVDCDPVDIVMDAAVEVCFRRHASGQKLPVFRLVHRNT